MHLLVWLFQLAMKIHLSEFQYFLQHQHKQGLHSFQLQLVLCQSEYFSLKIKSEFGNCTTYQVPITLKNPFSNYESPSIINFTLAVKSFYVSFSTFLAIESTYTALLQIWKKTKTPFVRLILISHVQSIADCCFKFLEVEVNGPKLDSRYLEWVYVNK